MYGFRYHLVTLIAVFMSLGIGILLGGSYGQDMFANQQIDLVSRLEAKYTASRAENSKWNQKVNELFKQTEQLNQMIRQLGEQVDRGKLAGKTVVLLQLEQGKLNPITSFLEKAGASLQTITVKDPDFLTDPTLLPVFANGIENADTALDWVHLLNEKKAIDLHGSIAKRPDAVVVIGSIPKYPQLSQPFEIPLLRELQKQSIRVIGAERSDSDSSLIPIYRNLKIPTVDNLDQAAGLLTLIELINGTNGHYGVKQTAETFFPAFSETTGKGMLEVLW